MLLSQTLLRLLTALDNGSLQWECLPETLLKEEIPILTLQILSQILDAQSSDGSWGSKHEVTSYAILSLIALFPLPWMQSLGFTIKIAITRGQRYLSLQKDRWTRGEYLWIEKVTYSSTTLSLAYCLSAAKSMPVIRHWGPKLDRVDIFTKNVSMLSQFFGALPLYSATPFEQIQTACLQSQFFLKRVQRLPLAIFPHKSKKNSYLQYVPFTWTSCNNKSGGILEPTVLEDMIQLSLIVYEADEFMETMVEDELSDNLDGVRAIIRRLCSGKDTNGSNQNGHASENGLYDLNAQSQKRKLTEVHMEGMKNNPIIPQTNGYTLIDSLPDVRNGNNSGTSTSELANLQRANNTLQKFTSHILTHPKVLTSHHRLQTTLAHELQKFLFAHVTHAEDNARFAVQDITTTTKDSETSNCTNSFAKSFNGNATSRVFLNPGFSFFNWVRTTSADHTSCPFAFIFYLCLISPPYTDPFPSPRSTYVAQDLCHHLATMCRQYNDFGSVVRDAAEGNLNSLNFPEFHQQSDKEVEGKGKGEEFGAESDEKEVMKKDLMWIAEYERGLLRVAMETLTKEKVNSKVLRAVKIFVDVTDLYGQIYIQRDLTATKYTV